MKIKNLDLENVYQLNSHLKSKKNNISFKKTRFITDNISPEMHLVAYLSKISKEILEIGFDNVRNTLLLSMNSPDLSNITSITQNDNIIKKSFQFNDQGTEISLKIKDEKYFDELFGNIEFNCKVFFHNLESLSFDSEILEKIYDLVTINLDYLLKKFNPNYSIFAKIKKRGFLIFKSDDNNNIKIFSEILNKKEIFHINKTSFFLLDYRK